MTPSPGDMASSVPMGSHRHILASPLHSSALKALASSMAFTSQNLLALDSGSNCGSTASSASSSAGCDFRDVDQIPAFAHSFYSLLVDLHDMFNNLPALERALVCVRKMLLEVEKGKEVDCEVLSHVNKFRIAVEGLRVALNSKARSPLKQEKKLPKDANFYELPYEDKCHALFAQALKRQAKDFGTVVAIVDASSLAGIRSYWNTSLPRDVADLADNCFISDTFDDASEGDDPKRRNVLGGKPVVAVGAGAATVVGVTSFSKIVPVSTIAKMVTFKVPTIVKFGLLQTKRTAAVTLGKVFTPAKLLAPASKGIIPGKIGFGYGVHVPATAKTAAAAEKLRAATHSVIAAAERSSLSAMRTAFYGIMRKRHGKATGGTPWVSFGGSILACTGLLELLATSGKKSLDPSFSCYGNRCNIIAWACMLVNEGREHEVFTPGLRDTAPREDLKITSPCYNVSCRYTFGFSFTEATCEALNTITTSCTELVMAVPYFFRMEFKAENPVLSILIHPVS